MTSAEAELKLSTQQANWLSDYRKDVFTQYGDDGVIEKIFSILPELTRWCVEFGAWDGIHYSNTRRLLTEKGWSGVLIEGDAERFRQLCENNRGNDRAVCVNKMVTLEGAATLDAILAETPIPQNFDLLSIDIDGNDYHVWKSVTTHRPKVVLIEFNNTIPNSVDFIQAADFSVNQGSSLRAMCELGKAKGYELIAVTDFNAYFVDRQYFQMFQISDNRPEVLNADQKFVTHVFQLYDGSLGYAGNLTHLWNHMDISRLQLVPRFCRTFVGDLPLPLWKKTVLGFYRFLNSRR